MGTFTSFDPFHQKVLQTYALTPLEEIPHLIAKAEKSFQHWKNMLPHERRPLFEQLANVLLEKKLPLAELMAQEMGKPITQGMQEVLKCAQSAKYYAQHIEDFLKDEKVTTEAKENIITYEPLGGILLVMPWNFPLWQVFRCAIPVLLAGNVCLLKHASNVSGCALMIEKIFQQASTQSSLPPHLFQTLLLESQNVPVLIRHSFIQGVSLTGSVSAGKAVARVCGENLKKSVLELGGSDPYLILEDADLDLAVKECWNSRMQNAGQSCIAAKRVFVPKKLQEEFIALSKIYLQQSIVMGDPLQAQTTLGPLAKNEFKIEAQKQVQQTIQAGAEVITFGDSQWVHQSDRDNNFFAPTLLTKVTPKMTAFQEEIFAGALGLITYEHEEAAITMANQGRFGLGSAIFSRDEERAKFIAKKQMDAGMCFINQMVRSDSRLPFGGIKESGYGRELAGVGPKEFVNIKVISVR